MSEILRGKPSNIDTAGNVIGRRIPLSEIPRPYSITNVLDLKGDGIMINDEIVLSFGLHYDREVEASVSRVHITREMTQPIIFEKTGQETRNPRRQDYLGIGEFGELYIGLRPSRPVCYIGERYKLSRIDADKTSFKFKLESTDPIEFVDPVTTNQNIPGFLKEIRARKARKST